MSDLVTASRSHSGTRAASVHSGATGDLLFELRTPFLPVWWSDGVVIIEDESGDGVSEIVLIGAHSWAQNSPNGVFRVYSGADGSLLREVPVAPGVILPGVMQAASISLGDIDGDGSADLLCRATLPLGGVVPTLLSSSTGAVIYRATPSGLAHSVGDALIALDDHDNDGLPDFAAPVEEGGRSRVEIYSAATGALIRKLRPPSGIGWLGSGTLGIGEQLISVADLDGDSLRDIAIGVVLFGRSSIMSSADGSELMFWTCDSAADLCIGQRFTEVDDISGDGHPDLITVGALPAGAGPVNMFGLDPVTGDVLFEQDMPNLCLPYSSAKRLITMSGLDENGFPRVAMGNCNDEIVEIKRVMPDLGLQVCSSVPNSSGAAAVLSVHGSASQAADSLFLRVEGAAPQQAVFFVYGSQNTQLPFGNGTLCVGGQLGRLPVGTLDAHGHATLQVGFNQLQASGSTWTFQAIFRDAVSAGFSSSDAVALELLP